MISSVWKLRIVPLRQREDRRVLCRFRKAIFGARCMQPAVSSLRTSFLGWRFEYPISFRKRFLMAFSTWLRDRHGKVKEKAKFRTLNIYFFQIVTGGRGPGIRKTGEEKNNGSEIFVLFYNNKKYNNKFILLKYHQSESVTCSIIWRWSGDTNNGTVNTTTEKVSSLIADSNNSGFSPKWDVLSKLTSNQRFKFTRQ